MSVNVLSNLHLPVTWDVLTLISVTICTWIFLISEYENRLFHQMALFKKHPCGVKHSLPKNIIVIGRHSEPETLALEANSFC